MKLNGTQAANYRPTERIQAMAASADFPPWRCNSLSGLAALNALLQDLGAFRRFDLTENGFGCFPDCPARPDRSRVRTRSL
jgi:hypothetical protein